jgi:hypothetical protein
MSLASCRPKSERARGPSGPRKWRLQGSSPSRQGSLPGRPWGFTGRWPPGRRASTGSGSGCGMGNSRPRARSAAARHAPAAALPPCRRKQGRDGGRSDSGGRLQLLDTSRLTVDLRDARQPGGSSRGVLPRSRSERRCQRAETALGRALPAIGVRHATGATGAVASRERGTTSAAPTVPGGAWSVGERRSRRRAPRHPSVGRARPPMRWADARVANLWCARLDTTCRSVCADPCGTGRRACGGPSPTR